MSFPNLPFFKINHFKAYGFTIFHNSLGIFYSILLKFGLFSASVNFGVLLKFEASDWFDKCESTLFSFKVLVSGVYSGFRVPLSVCPFLYFVLVWSIGNLGVAVFMSDIHN